MLMSGAVKIELLSADVYTGDEITTEDKYPVEYFRSETLPEPESEEEITDWDALYEEAWIQGISGVGRGCVYS